MSPCTPVSVPAKITWNVNYSRIRKSLHRMSPCTPVSVPAKITWNVNYSRIRKSLHRMSPCTPVSVPAKITWNVNYSRIRKSLHRMSPCTPVSVPAKITWNVNYSRIRKSLHRMSPCTPVSVPAKITWNVNYSRIRKSLSLVLVTHKVCWLKWKDINGLHVELEYSWIHIYPVRTICMFFSLRKLFISFRFFIIDSTIPFNFYFKYIRAIPELCKGASMSSILHKYDIILHFMFWL